MEHSEIKSVSHHYDILHHYMAFELLAQYKVACYFILNVRVQGMGGCKKVVSCKL
jgi:hypothetical protein